MGSVLIKASIVGGTSPTSLSTTANRVVMDRISIEMSSLSLSEISSGIKWKSMMNLASDWKPLTNF
jgi:hypothetical protein